MNLNTMNLTINPCVVCEYLFADRHHIWPQAKGGEKLPTINLCPNHHRYANIVQAMLLQGRPRDEIEVFAYQHFDQAFNEVMLTFLMDEQERVSWRGWSYHYTAQILEAARARDRATALAAWVELGMALLAKGNERFTPLSIDQRQSVAAGLERWLATGEINAQALVLLQVCRRMALQSNGVPTLESEGIV